MWTPPYSGHLPVPRAIFAGNEPLKSGHFSILDCGPFFPVPSAVKNLLKMESRLTSRHLWHCLRTPKQKFGTQTSGKILRETKPR
jgi:hypothetical protein